MNIKKLYDDELGKEIQVIELQEHYNILDLQRKEFVQKIKDIMKGKVELYNSLENFIFNSLEIVGNINIEEEIKSIEEEE